MTNKSGEFPTIGTCPECHDDEGHILREAEPIDGIPEIEELFLPEHVLLVQRTKRGVENKFQNKRNSSCCGRRSTLECWLLLLLLLLCIIFLCIGLLFALGFLPVKSELNDRNNDTSTLCTTPVCVHAASDMLKKLDRDINPCDNFYRFACGGFLKSTRIPEDGSEKSILSTIRNNVQEHLRITIEEPSPSTELRPTTLAKNLYKACMNTTAIGAQSTSKLLSDLQELGGWPVLEGDEWDADSFNWIELTYKAADLGYPINYFLRTTIAPDWKNNKKRVIYIDKPSVKVPPRSLENANLDYMVDIAVMLGATREWAISEMRLVLNFQNEMYNAILLNDADRYSEFAYTTTTITGLSASYPTIPWKEYLNHLLAPSLQTSDCEVIIRQTTSYINDLEELLAETPKKTQANYIIWKVIEESLPYLNDKLRRQGLQWREILEGKADKEPRWKECMDVVLQKLPMSIGSLYVQKYFHEEAKEDAIAMVNNIGQQFHQMLQNIDWMDDETRAKAREKAASIIGRVGYPDEFLDDRIMEEYYQALELSDNHYLQGIQNITLFDTKNSFSRLRQPFSKSDWTMYGNPARVDINYDPTLNVIDLPAGILQDVLISNDLPKYMSYGAIGPMIGHEIAHGFDDQGRWFDKDGNRVNWWGPSTMEIFSAKAQCMIDQYDKYSVQEVGLQLDGNRTQRENIADNGGLKGAYLAYDDWLTRNGEEEMLPGLPYTPKQMFWMSAVNTLCTVQGPENLKLQITSGVRSPAEFRVLGALSNIPAFAEDFECPVGSEMNPEEKCGLW